MNVKTQNISSIKNKKNINPYQLVSVYDRDCCLQIQIEKPKINISNNDNRYDSNYELLQITSNDNSFDYFNYILTFSIHAISLFEFLILIILLLMFFVKEIYLLKRFLVHDTFPLLLFLDILLGWLLSEKVIKIEKKKKKIICAVLLLLYKSIILSAFTISIFYHKVYLDYHRNGIIQ
ncbi:hypothetical protein GVAV_003092 [Gurleya vavrai]